MDALNTLLSQFSIEGLILLGVLFLVAVKFVGELFEYCYNKIKKYFDIKDEKEERHEEIMNSLKELKQQVSEQEELSKERSKQITNLSVQLKEQEDKSQIFQKA